MLWFVDMLYCIKLYVHNKSALYYVIILISKIKMMQKLNKEKDGNVEGQGKSKSRDHTK